MRHSRISVVSYPDSHGKLFTLDSCRLFCLKDVYSPSKQVWVYRYASVADYDPEWNIQFSTLTYNCTIPGSALGVHIY